MKLTAAALTAFVVSCTGLLAACSSPSSSTPAATATDGGTPTATATSWYATGKPFVDRYCASCHGGAGPGTGDFTSYENVSALAPAMLASVTSGRMPPGAADPGCRDYQNSDRRFVSEADRASFAKWIAEGMPKGDPKDAVVVPPIDETIPNPDLVIKPAVAYTPTFSNPNEPGNEYRCFAIRPGLTSSKFITSMGPVIDKRSMVHHIVAYRIDPSHLPAAAQNDPPEGWSCIDMVNAGLQIQGDPRTSDGMIVAWAPGTGAFNLPEDSGIIIKKTDVIVLQIHYFRSGKEPAGTKDQTGFAFKFADMVSNKLAIAPVGQSGFRIPAGDANYSFTGSYGPLPVDIKLYGTMPHMHVLGTKYELSYTAGGAKSCLARSDKYDFGNQVTYLYKEPVTVPAGSKVDFRCTFDNSAGNPNQFNDPPKEVTYGERTDQEMCYAFSLLGL